MPILPFNCEFLAYFNINCQWHAYQWSHLDGIVCVCSLCVVQDWRRQCAKIKQLPFDLCVYFAICVFSPSTNNMHAKRETSAYCLSGTVFYILLLLFAVVFFLCCWHKLCDRQTKKNGNFKFQYMKHIEIWKQVKVSAFVLNECACMPNNLWVFHGQQLKQRTHTNTHTVHDRAHIQSIAMIFAMVANLLNAK